MLTNCYESSISSAKTTGLWINVVINIYNLVILWCNNNSATQVLLGESYDAKQYIIAIETFLTLSVVMQSAIIPSLIMFSIKFWILGVTFVFLSVDMMLTCTRFFDLLLHKRLDEFWRIRTNQREWDETVSAPPNLYLIVAIVLTLYFVFKLYATYTILFIGKTLLYEISGDGYLLNDEDIERNSSRDQSILSMPPPPTYDQSVMETSLASSSLPLEPPPYSVVQKY